MINNTLLFKILSRYLKEKKIFNEYKNSIYCGYFNNLKNIHEKNYRSILASFTFMNSNKTFQQRKINNFFLNYIHITEFNKIINLITKKHYLDFLEKNSLIKLFSTRIFENRKMSSLYSLKISYNINLNKKANSYKIIDRYVNALSKQGYSIFELFNKAFSWSSTNEGHEYWYLIHKSYVEYMWKKILVEVK